MLLSRLGTVMLGHDRNGGPTDAIGDARMATWFPAAPSSIDGTSLAGEVEPRGRVG